MKKVLLLLLLAIPFKTEALSVDKVYIDAETDIGGTLQIKEVIVTSDQNEDFIFNVFYKDKSLKKFTKTKESFYASDIYNGSSVEILKAGIVKKDYKLEDIYNEEFINNVEFFEDLSVVDKKEYYQTKLKSSEKNNIYYLEYNVYNVLVEHNDCAELYYPFMKNFNYDAKEVTIITHLAHNSILFETWAHGANNAVVTKDDKSSIMKSELSNYKKGEFLDNRIIFDKDIFSININKSKKSEMDAIDLIKTIERERSNNQNTRNKLFNLLIIVFSLLLVLLVSLFVYKKIKQKNCKVLH